MRGTKILAFIVLTSIYFSSAIASACQCIADPYSKQYIYFKKTWYGSKRKWTCVYTCQDMQQRRVQIKGTHEDWYTSDRGLEGICDGLHYVNRYSTARMDFFWDFEEARHFSAADSSALELKQWNRKNCQR